MKTYLGAGLFVLVWAVAAPALSATIDFSKSEPDAVGLAETAWQESIAEAKEAGASVSIRALKHDLNADGKPEILGELNSEYLCGRSGPCFFVMSSANGKFDVMFSVPGVETVRLTDTKTAGWLDIMLNDDDRYRYNGATYSSQ
ncbi:hypothetical protein [Iodidimonas sp. SYSU 1G8]|uniref:hypothetical protein n=1 Tax=Iodidimonas sp. SYSU 1G8 TaxID=3133967 RepID=UPI0031FEE0CE